MNNFDIPKTAKIILYCIIYVPLSIMIIFLLFRTLIDAKSTKEYYLEDHKCFKINSVIVEIYRDKRNHNNQTLKFRNDTLITLPFEWENNFKVGDSISKTKGSLEILHYRNHSLKETLNYNETVKNRKE